MKSEFLYDFRNISGNTVESRGQTGFQSPCNDYAEPVFDLNAEFIPDKVSCFFFEMEGGALIGDHIREGDVLVVDKSKLLLLDPRVHFSTPPIVVCIYQGERIVRHLEYLPDGIALTASHPKFKTLYIRQGEELEVWGVVINIHRQIFSKP